MSALAGIVFFDQGSVPTALVERMTAAMAHRGPDGIRHRQVGNAAFGLCLLHTTPESVHECQPLLLEDGRGLLVFAGRIDNRTQLTKDLVAKGHMPCDDTDAELLLRAWYCWQERCTDHVIGDFVFFVWNAATHQLFGARDVTGVRHCYYAVGDGWFAFASEMNALFASGLVERRLNEDFLYDYLSDEYERIDGHCSWFKQVQRLPHAHAISVTAGGQRCWRYWQPENQPQRQSASLQECREGFLEVLTEATRCRLRSNGPVGLMLSGGVDSSSIAGLIGKRLGNCLTQPLQTYSLIRQAREQCLDWPHIQTMLADNPGFSPTIIDSNLSEAWCLQLLEDIQHYDSPQPIAEALVHIVLAKAANQRGCRVLLEGFAADTLFLSPETSLERAFKYHLWQQLPAIMASWRNHHVAGLPLSLLRLMLRESTPQPVRTRWQQLNRTRRLVAELENSMTESLLPAATARDYIQRRQTQRQSLDADVNAKRPMAPELCLLLRPMLAYAYEVNEILCGQHQVELRGPFSDRRVLEYVFAMPIEAKFSRGWTKALLRECMTGIIPDSVRLRTIIAGHPGWEFSETLIRHWRAAAPGFWRAPHSGGQIERLLDPAALGNLYHNSDDYWTALRVMKLAVLWRWLHTSGTDNALISVG